jgi:hypothetical protein
MARERVFGPMIERPDRNYRQWLKVAIVLLLAAFAIRGFQFGNPLIEVDENFYLLVGDRMLHGALPYVDIWDRKPIGLFLIFAAIRRLGGDGIVQTQIMATLFVAGTAWLIARIAAQMADMVAATAAAILYILLLNLIGGSGAQAPIFYNLFVAGAALATLRAVRAPADPQGPRRVRWLGAVAMLLLGIGLQIKYTVVFEGIFFGLVLLHRSWVQSQSVGRMVADSGLWLAIVLAPTVVAFAAYAAQGEAAPFIFANFLSIGNRSSAAAGVLIGRLGRTCISIALPMLAVLLGRAIGPWRMMAGGRTASTFVLSWIGAAVAGYLLFGTYANHYALPLFVPISAACAPLFAYRRHHLGAGAAALMLILAGFSDWSVIHHLWQKRGDRAFADAVTATIRPRLTNCLYVWNGDPIYYYLTQSCLPGPYPFPSHLNNLIESRALGMDPIVELRRILANRPSVILDSQPRDDDINPAAARIVDAELRRSYRQVAAFGLQSTSVIVYQRVAGR